MNTQPEAQYDTEWEQRWPNAVTPQPVALQLADYEEAQAVQVGASGSLLADELRRLHALNCWRR